MLSRTFVRAAASAPRSGVRALSTTALRQQSKTPSMGDVNPSRAAVDTFNKRQKEFREQLVAAQREREASESSTPELRLTLLPLAPNSRYRAHRIATQGAPQRSRSPSLVARLAR